MPASGAAAAKIHGGVEDGNGWCREGVVATEEERGERTQTRSGRRRVEEMSRTTLMEPPSPPRSMGRSRRLVRRRGLGLQATTGCFLQRKHLVPKPKNFGCQINSLIRCQEDFSDTN